MTAVENNNSCRFWKNNEVLISGGRLLSLDPKGTKVDEISNTGFSQNGSLLTQKSQIRVRRVFTNILW